MRISKRDAHKGIPFFLLGWADFKGCREIRQGALFLMFGFYPFQSALADCLERTIFIFVSFKESPKNLASRIRRVKNG